MFVENLIDKKYAKQIEENSSLTLSDFKKAILKKKFFVSLYNVIDSFLNIPIDYLNKDLKRFTNDTLKLTDYDRECRNYNISTLNLKNILSELTKLYYNQIYADYYVIKELSKFFPAIVSLL